MSAPNPALTSSPACPLDTIAVMAAILIAGDLSSGCGCSQNDQGQCDANFYAGHALQLYLAAQRHVEYKLRSLPNGG